MNFQDTLPYAADSGLHVIEGVDLTGPPIYQRSGLDRVKAVDIYELLQGIIERCLATIQPDGSYLVSPTIFNETIELGEYAEMSQWTEEGGSGYAANLMDNYPHALLLRAIDNKITELASCTPGPIHDVSWFGTFNEATLVFTPYDNKEAIFQAAGVDFQYPIETPGLMNSGMLLKVPARASESGVDEFGIMEDSVRLYPEVLIARYKVLQVMRYVNPPLINMQIWNEQEPNPLQAGVGENWVYFPSHFYYDYGYNAYIWYDSYKETYCNQTVDEIKDKISNGSNWRIQDISSEIFTRNYNCFWSRQGTYYNSWQAQFHQDNPRWTFVHYGLIPKCLEVWATVPGGSNTVGLFDYMGDQLGAGVQKVEEMNLIPQFSNSTDYDSLSRLTRAWDYVWEDGPANGVSNISLNIPLTVLADYHFQFCRHHDFFGDVTWTL